VHAGHWWHEHLPALPGWARHLQAAATRRRSSGAPARRGVWLEHAALALVAYVPQLLSQPGVVDSDTKTYLYQDPAHFLHQSMSMWDPSVGLGTVTHEQIGYLFPMGPFFLLLHVLHVPLWAAQRLWVGSILFAAGAGVLYLARTIGLRGPGRAVAALAFMLSPYVLQYVGRISVILLPWAGLPWLVAMTARSLRQGGWRYPALFALVVLAISGVNASSLIYVGIAPVLWLPYAVVVAKEHSWRQALDTAWRIGLLSVAVSLWWIVGLQIEGADGVNVLKYTETVPAVSSTSLASEVLRGLGYWYFYGGDRLGQWVDTSIQFTQSLAVLALSFAVPTLAVIAAVAVRWRHRAYFVLVTVVGMLFAVGAHPFDAPSAVGAVLKAFFTHTTAGLALRSTDRASPLVVLGLAMLLGAGISALVRKVRPVGLIVTVLVVGIVAAANPPIWDGATVADKFVRPAQLPTYVLQAAAALDAEHPGTRVLAIPGENFAQYRWGDTIDPVLPGELDASRPFVTREQLILGSLPTADVLYALDQPMQDGTLDPSAIAPLARLMSAGDVLVQNDLGFERYDQPHPLELWAELSPPPAGLGQPVGFGSPRPNVPVIPKVDEAVLGAPAALAVPAPLEALPVANTRPLVRAEPVADPLIVDGDAEGIAAAGLAGLLDTNPPVLYAGTLDSAPRLAAQALAGDSTLVLTDTNRKRAFRWNTLTGAAGYTMTAAEQQPNDPTDAPLDLFPGAPADAQTTAVQLGVAAVTASSYGNPVSYQPEARPINAIDGNPDTAWTTGAYGTPEGQWWQVQLDTPVTTDHITLLQPTRGAPDRWITQVTLSFDGGRPVTVDLGPPSRRGNGQVVSFPRRTFTTLRITIDRTNLGTAKTDHGNAAVGFAEVQIPGVVASEVIAMPQDLLRMAGSSSLSHRLVVVMTRERAAPYPPHADPEVAIDRTMWLPTTRTFSVSGLATLNSLIPDDAIDRLVGRPGSDGSGIVAYSSGRLPGDLQAGASAALDGDPSTAWMPGFGADAQLGAWIEVDLPRPLTFDHLDLQVVADGLHSVPTSLRIQDDSGSVEVSLPPIADGRQRGATVSVPVHFPPLTGTHIKVTVTGVRLEQTVNYYSRQPIAMPMAIAELGIPGVQVPPVPAQLPGTCRSDLLAVDGHPVPVAVVGTTASALAGSPVALVGCGSAANGITLGPGLHTITTVPGHTGCVTGPGGPCAGVDVDQLVLDSAPGGGPEPLDVRSSGATAAGPTGAGAIPAGTVPPTPAVPAPTVTVTGQTATTIHLQVTGAHGPFWLVLGESVNRGWQATVDGGPRLGGSTLIDGFANGWVVDPAVAGTRAPSQAVTMTLRWTPQSHVDLALVLSALATMACLVLAVAPGVARRGRRGRHVRLQAPAGSVLDAPGSGPELASPLLIGGRRPPWARAVAIAVAYAVVVALLTQPTTGMAVGLAVFTTLVVARGRWMLTVGAIVLVAATGAYVVIHQATAHPPPGGSWPEQFELAHVMAWMGVAFLGADAVIEIGRRARPGPAGATATTPPAADDTGAPAGVRPAATGAVAQPPGAQPPVAQPPGAQPPVAQPPGAQPPGAQPPSEQPRLAQRPLPSAPPPVPPPPSSPVRLPSLPPPPLRAPAPPPLRRPVVPPPPPPAPATPAPPASGLLADLQAFIDAILGPEGSDTGSAGPERPHNPPAGTEGDGT